MDPKHLEIESTKHLQALVGAIDAELKTRGDKLDATTLYTFVKKKEGKLLNKDGKYVSLAGAKVAALFEFKSADKKSKDFMISSSCRGIKEPEEDKTSKYGDANKYYLFLDDDDVITGCYKE